VSSLLYLFLPVLIWINTKILFTVYRVPIKKGITESPENFYDSCYFLSHRISPGTEYNQMEYLVQIVNQK